jgi:hypothetical protein
MHVVGEIVVVVERDPTFVMRVSRHRATGGRRGRGGLGRWLGLRAPDPRGGGGGALRWGPAGGRDGAIVAIGSIVEPAARGGAGDVLVGIVGGVLVEIVEAADEGLGFRQLGKIDLAAADQIEDQLAELGEGILAAAVGAGIVEARATFAGTALEDVTGGIADDTRLLEGGVEKSSESPA